MSEEEKQKFLFNIIRQLALSDAKFIDTLAKTLDINQNHIYQLFIKYHEFMFSRMYKEE